MHVSLVLCRFHNECCSVWDIDLGFSVKNYDIMKNTYTEQKRFVTFRFFVAVLNDNIRLNQFIQKVLHC